MKTIVITNRGDDYHAQLDGTKAWGCGDSVSEAIGDLVRSHPERFGIAIIEGDTE